MKPISITYEQTEYNFLENYQTSLSLQPAYYKILLRLSNGNINTYLKYLYNRYHKKLLRTKIAHIKKSATTQYQEITNRYSHWKIWISPYTWDRYWDLRRVCGYSISYIVRIFLEWELLRIIENAQESLKTLKKKYKYIYHFPINKPDYPLTHYQWNSYVILKSGDSHKNGILIKWLDVYW